MSDHHQRVNKRLRKEVDPTKPETHPFRLQMVHHAMNQSLAPRKATVASSSLLDIAYYPGVHQFYDRYFPYLKQKEKISPMANFQQYKAILDVDGNSWSERFAKLLCMNSVVIKVEPEFVDYFWHQVKPWVHYVPVQQDSGDLWEIAQYVMDHDEDMRRIARNARQWCQDNMRYERLMEFVLDSLAFYVEMLEKHDPEWTARWQELLDRDKENRLWRPRTKV